MLGFRRHELGRVLLAIYLESSSYLWVLAWNVALKYRFQIAGTVLLRAASRSLRRGKKWRAVTAWNPFPPLRSKLFSTLDGHKYNLDLLIPAEGKGLFDIRVYDLDDACETLLCTGRWQEVNLKENRSMLIERGIYLKGVAINGGVMNLFPPIAVSWAELRHVKSRLRAYQARRQQLGVGADYSPLAGTMDFPVRTVMPLRILLYLQHAGVKLSHGLLNFGAHDGVHVDPIGMVLQRYGAEARGVYYEYDASRCGQLRSNLNSYAGGRSQIMVLCPFYVSVDRTALAPFRRLRGVPYAPSSNLLDVDVIKFDIEGPDCLVLMQVLQHVDAKMIVMEVNNVPPPFAFCSDTLQCSLSWLVHRLGNLGPIGYGLYRWGGCNTIFLRKDLLKLLKHGLGFDEVGATWRLGMDEFESFRHAPVCGHGISPSDVHRFFYPENVDNTTDAMKDARSRLPALRRIIQESVSIQGRSFNHSFELYVVSASGSAIYS